MYENTTFKAETSCKARGEVFIDWRLRLIGLWSMKNPIPTWEFRNGSSKTDTTQAITAVEYHANSKSVILYIRQDADFMAVRTVKRFFLTGT